MQATSGRSRSSTPAASSSDRTIGYNGRDGVLTDPDGLLYMRARYYSPVLKRFLNCDIIDGSIEDSTTLNLYAYVNGNPISFVDPFGLSKDMRNNVGLKYDGKEYPIYVPSSYEDFADSNWKTIYEDSDNDVLFDLVKFLFGIELEDINGEDVYAGNVLVSPGYISDTSSIEKGGALSLFVGVLNSINDSVNVPYVSLKFQESDNGRRVIIMAGSNNATKLFDCYSGCKNSLYLNSGNGKVLAMNCAANFYQNITGNEAEPFKTYDIVVTVDSRHRDNPVASYLWVSDNGTVMETPAIYSGDKVEVGTRGFLGFGFKSLANVDLGGSSPIAPEYQSVFNRLLEKYK